MRSIRKMGGIVLFLLAPAAGAPACVAESADSAPATPETRKTDELLQVVELDGAHRVEFYRLKAGDLAIHEVMDIGQGPFLSDKLQSQGNGLAGIFRAVAPNTEVPAKLI